VGAAYLVHAVVAPRRALEATRSRLQAAGERLTIEECVGPRVPAHEAAARRFLLAAQSLWAQRSLAEQLDCAAPRAMEMVAPGKALVGWQQGALPGDQGRCPAILRDRARLARGSEARGGTEAVAPVPAPPTWEDLAVGLRHCAPALNEIREASRAAAFDWSLDYSQDPARVQPYLILCPAVVRGLQAAILLALHEGRRDDALEFLETQLRIVRHFPPNGLETGEGWRLDMASLAWSATWEALQAEGWTDDQLRRLQQAWQETDFIGCMIRGLEMERALGLTDYAHCREDPGRLGTLIRARGGGRLGGTGPPPLSIRNLSSIPWRVVRSFHCRSEGARARVWAWTKSWDDERCYLEMTHLMITEARARLALARPPRVLPLTLPAGKRFVLTGVLSPSVYDPIRRHMLASISLLRLDTRMAIAFPPQAQREMALTAVALKRHQLRHGTHPEDLAELVPAFLSEVPMDWMDGQPLRYRRLEGQRFLLYSVSDDGIDQGGDPTVSGVPRKSVALDKGRDFVWPEAVSP